VDRQGGMFFPEMQPFSGMLKKNHIQSSGIASSYYEIQVLTIKRFDEAGRDAGPEMQHLSERQGKHEVH
jgi:hypothetical protein